jgi:uncharacterized protein (DUF1810 family)
MVPEGIAKTDDPFALSRFLTAQAESYETSLGELRAGQKRTHWIWYIFPQIDGLAFSSTSKYFSIKSLDEASAFLEHPVLGHRLQECAEAVLAVDGRSIREILGSPDDLKLKSCATLFACISPKESVFEQVLQKYYGGKRDDATLRLLGLPGTPD